MSEVLYYPGCSMSGTARAYRDSIEAVAEPLGLHLREIEDWNCCGATEYLGLGQLRAHALIARNLALAERQRNGSDRVVAPCSACFVNLAKTEHYLREDAHLARQVNRALAAGDLSYTPGTVEVRHLFDVVAREVGLDEVARRVVRPLTGLRLAPYLGCLVTRPDPDDRWPAHEQPREFDRLLAALGADVVDYPLRTDCCGGHMSQISPATGLELIRRLVSTADRLGADAMVTVCPMCQMNVDMYQGEANRRFRTSYHMPILFFTQVMGLAFGFEPSRLGFGTEVVSASGALAKLGLGSRAVPDAGAVGEARASEAGDSEETSAGGSTATATATAERPRRPKKPQGLPMPHMPGDEEAGR